MDGQEREHREKAHPGSLSTAINPREAHSGETGESPSGRSQRLGHYVTGAPQRSGFCTRRYKMGISYSVFREGDRIETGTRKAINIISDLHGHKYCLKELAPLLSQINT